MSETKATLEDQVRAIAAVAFPNDREARRQYANQILALIQSNGDERERVGRVDETQIWLSRLLNTDAAPDQLNDVMQSMRARKKYLNAALTKAREAGKCDECPRPIERPLVGKCSHHADLMPAGQEGEVKL